MFGVNHPLNNICQAYRIWNFDIIDDLPHFWYALRFLSGQISTLPGLHWFMWMNGVFYVGVKFFIFLCYLSKYLTLSGYLCFATENRKNYLTNQNYLTMPPFECTSLRRILFLVHPPLRPSLSSSIHRHLSKSWPSGWDDGFRMLGSVLAFETSKNK